MVSIKARFREATEKYPDLSSFVCFGRAVEDQQFTRKYIQRWFNNLVSKGDYEEDGRNMLIQHFCSLSKSPVEGDFQTEIGTGDEFEGEDDTFLD